MVEPCRFKLQNGIDVFYIRRPTKGLCYAQLNFTNGYILENHNQLDFTHIGEHLFALWTSTKNPDHNAIIKLLGTKGVEQNAYTSNFDTGYHFQGRVNDLAIFLTLFFQMMYDYKFTADWDKQKNIVLEELKMRSSEAFNDLQDLEDEIVYGKNHRLGCNFKDSIQVVKGAALSDVLNYNRESLKNSNCLLSIEADMDVATLQKLLNRLILKNKSIKKPQIYPPSPPLIEEAKIYSIKIPNVQSSKIVFYFQHQWSLFDLIPKIQTIQTLNYFCRGYFSKLYQTLREELGYVYGISSEQYFPPKNVIPGFVKIVMNVDEQNIEKVIESTKKEIIKLQTELIDDDNLKRIKNENEIEYAELKLQNPVGKFIKFYSHYILWNQKLVTIEQYYKLSSKITKQEILRHSKKLFNLDKMLIFIATPIS